MNIINWLVYTFKIAKFGTCAQNPRSAKIYLQIIVTLRYNGLIRTVCRTVNGNIKFSPTLYGS